MALAWAVEPLWRSLTDDPQAQTVPPAAQAHHLLVWRDGLETRWRTLPEEEAAALAGCIGGLRFDELCARVAAAPAAAPATDEADAAARVAGWLGQWVQAGLLVFGPEPA